MSCCSTPGTCGCPVQPCPSKRVVAWFPRIALGLVFVGYGVNHYRGFSGATGFKAMAMGVYPTVPALAAIAGVLAYVVPALMIVGGVLFAIRQLCCISKMCIVTALSGILGWAGLAIMVGDGATAQQVGPAIINAAILFLLYGKVKKMGCCGGACPTGK